MKEETHYLRLVNIYKANGGYITRDNVVQANIPTWFLSDFVKRNNLKKIAPGFYASDDYVADDYYILQKRYPKYVYSGLSTLYLLGLTDKIPSEIEVSAPQGYNPSRNKLNNVIIRRYSNKKIYEYGIKKIKTMFGNEVMTYDEERTICDIIKNRRKYDAETFIKAVKLYVKTVNNQVKLFKYARDLGIEDKVYEVMELLINED